MDMAAAAVTVAGTRRWCTGARPSWASWGWGALEATRRPWHLKHMKNFFVVEPNTYESNNQRDTVNSIATKYKLFR